MNIQFRLDNFQVAKIKRQDKKKHTPGFGITGVIMNEETKAIDEDIEKVDQFKRKKMIKL